MKKHPVSIVIPVHNAGRFLDDTIRNILAQTYTDYEVIFVNDASGDNSLEVIRGFADRRFDRKV